MGVLFWHLEVHERSRQPTQQQGRLAVGPREGQGGASKRAASLARKERQRDGRDGQRMGAAKILGRTGTTDSAAKIAPGFFGLSAGIIHLGGLAKIGAWFQI